MNIKDLNNINSILKEYTNDVLEEDEENGCYYEIEVKNNIIAYKYKHDDEGDIYSINNIECIDYNKYSSLDFIDYLYWSIYDENKRIKSRLNYYSSFCKNSIKKLEKYKNENNINEILKTIENMSSRNELQHNLEINKRHYTDLLFPLYFVRDELKK